MFRLVEEEEGGCLENIEDKQKAMSRGNEEMLRRYGVVVDKKC